MRFLLLLFFPMLLFCSAKAQSCLPTGISLTTQQAVDDFPLNYPTCQTVGNVLSIGFNSSDPIKNLDSLYALQKINGSLYITNSDSLLNLDGLNNLDTIQGTISITINENLIDLAGLSNLDYLGGRLTVKFNPNLQYISSLSNLIAIQDGVQIEGNDHLSSLVGLSNVTSIGNELYIIDNPLLADLSGLESLTKINGGLVIAENDLMSSLSGINNLDTIGLFGLIIGENNSLTQLSGLDNLELLNGLLTITLNPLLNDISSLSNTSGIQQITITNNAALPNCAITSVCDLLGNGLPATIETNAVGCNSVMEVETACSPLPLEWNVPLTAKLKNKKVELKWSVTNQIENEYFEIQRSRNGLHYTTLSLIQGEGNLWAEKKYAFEDSSPNEGMNYYRVLQMDQDGNFSFSNIANLKFKITNSEILIYPNPAQDEIFINSEYRGKFMITNCLGEIVRAGEFNSNVIIVNTSHLSKGVYFVSFNNGDHSSFIIR